MQVTPKNTDNSNGLDLGQFWLKHSVYWPYYLLLLVLSLTGAWLYLRYTTPVYKAYSRILIKDESKGTDDSKATDFLNMIGSKKVLENEKEVIASKALLEQVVYSLGLYAPVFENTNIAPAYAYLSSPISVYAKEPDLLKYSDDIAFTFDREKYLVDIDGKNYQLDRWVLFNNDSLMFVTNPNYNGDIGKTYFFRLLPPGDVANMFKGNLEVSSASKNSTILTLELEDEVPARAIHVLNELMEVYNDYLLNDKNVLASNTLDFVQQRLNNVARDLDSVEKKLSRYQASRGAYNLSTQGELFLKNVSENDQKVSEINMQLAVLDQVEDYVHTKSEKTGIVPSTLGVKDPTLLQLLVLLYHAELDYEKMKTTEAENSAAMVSLRNQIQKIRPNIIENLRSQRTSLEASKMNLLSTNSSYSTALSSMPQKEVELLDISRQRNIISDIYTFLLQKREESALSYASTLANSTVVDKAEASGLPVNPKPRVIYMVAFILPFIVGIGTITVKESFSTKVLFRDEIEQVTSYPVIGELSYEKSDDPIVIRKNNRSFISEQLRQLRVALTLNKDGTTKKKILVTSSISGEGKSFVALNLAASFSLTGKKTVLLELDLTNPSISRNVNITSKEGIAEYLMGENEPEEIIKRVEGFENLFILPAGKTTEVHPSELLENGKINELLTYLEDIFDYIIVDTAPVNAITDAYIVSSNCDITLYLIRHNYTPKVFLQRLDQNNKNNQLNNISLLFNGIRPRGFGKHHFGYGYGYGYAYYEKNKPLKKVKA